MVVVDADIFIDFGWTMFCCVIVVKVIAVIAAVDIFSFSLLHRKFY